jgi:hypothetical protein
MPIRRSDLAKSLALHAALAAVAWVSLRAAHELAPALAAPVKPPISVTLRGGSPSSGPSAAPSAHARGRGSKRPDRGEQGLRLGLDFDLGRKSAKRGKGKGGTGEAEGRGRGSRDGYDTADAMTYADETRLYPFFRALWRRIDSSTGYPSDLVQERITGYVSVQLHVDRRGAFAGEIVSVRSDQPILEAYVLGILFHALREPLPSNLWAKGQPNGVILVTRFRFSTFSHGSNPSLELEPSLKNVLAFQRDRYVDPKLNQVVNRVLTRWMPPILPIPGGVFVDFFRLYQFVQNYRDRY